MPPLELLDLLTRIGIIGILLIQLFLMLSERLIPRGRMDETVKDLKEELARERQEHSDDRTAFRAAIQALTGKIRPDG